MQNSNITREIILDTETTGLSFENGDRIVEIGCIELINHVQTGNVYQTYINPDDRLMSKGASQISGITDQFLEDKPLFAQIADDFLNFVNASRLVIHNAKFDIGFLNNELKRIGKQIFKIEEVTDTLEIARRKFPGSPANLDALCKRFAIDRSARVVHGALVDCQLLAEVYIHLLGGRQSNLFTSDSKKDQHYSVKEKSVIPARNFPISEEEKNNHIEFLNQLKSPLWKIDV